MRTLSLILITAIAAGVNAQEMPTPNPEHEFLAKDVGVWKGTMKLYVQGPDAPAMELPFSETVTLMDGGFWTRTEFDAGPFKGHSQNGYDPIKKEFVSTWIDSSSPYIAVMKGKYDKEKKQMVMTYDGYDAATQKPAKFKSVNEHLGENERRFTMHQYNEDAKKWTKLFVMDQKRDPKKK